MKILAVDIGGANIKSLTHEDGVYKSGSAYFPLWKRIDLLQKHLKALDGQDADVVAVTMTGELSDIFPDKRRGVRQIVKACSKVFNEPLFLTSKQSLIQESAINEHIELGAVNWLASLYLMKKRFQNGILVDMGSTTTDILPFDEREESYYKSDLERLKSSELVYTGFERTPLNTIVDYFPIDGQNIPIASEYFAITADIYRILFNSEYCCETPDGRGKTKVDSAKRLARLLCTGIEEIESSITKICEHAFEKQIIMISEAIKKVSSRSGKKRVFVCGIGREVGKQAAYMSGFQTFDLEENIKGAWNLPCLGLVDMVIDNKKI